MSAPYGVGRAYWACAGFMFFSAVVSAGFSLLSLRMVGGHEYALATLRLTLGENPTMADFLGALRGARPEVSSGSGAAMAGKLLSVEQKSREKDKGGAAEAGECRASKYDSRIPDGCNSVKALSAREGYT